MSNHRLLVVSNRLPLMLKKNEDGWRADASAGGLASAMDPILKKMGGVWVGWAGEEEAIDPTERQRLLDQSVEEYRYSPVNIDSARANEFYEGYPNQALWPLFHYFPNRMSFREETWRTYLEGNRSFAEAVAAVYTPGDLIWVHDYHLLLLPSLLREQLPEARIGFFLHIPFPSSEVFAMLPHREEVLRGLLGADLIAFQTHRHLHHFRSSLLRILGVESGIDSVEQHARSICIQALPIGIAASQFTDLVLYDAETQRLYSDLCDLYQGQKLILAVDRMDYTKGIPERLRALRRLLTQTPSLAGKVVLIQVAVPSRENIESYQELRNEVNHLVGEINGKLGTPEWTPIIYINRSICKEELAALYKRADVAWITPLRDGMNLVAKEYCACKPEGNGVLVLSEFAGAAAEMGEALLVNPYDEDRVVDAVYRALTFDTGERVERMKALHDRVRRKSVFAWADDFLSLLQGLQTGRPGRGRWPERLPVSEAVSAFAAARQRVLLLDYDGTLVGIAPFPEQAKPGEPLLDLLARLSDDPANSIVLVSGRHSRDLDRWFGDIPGLILAAEHGATIRESSSSGWRTLRDLRDLRQPAAWKEKVRPILDHYVDRIPGSFVEVKEFSLAWHYRRAEPDFGEWLASELVALLEELLADTEARPVRGRKVVEVRPIWADKGELVRWMAARRPKADFWLAAGDDRTDEDLFARMPKGSWTVHVGNGVSRAAYTVPCPDAVIYLLEQMAALVPASHFAKH